MNIKFVYPAAAATLLLLSGCTKSSKFAAKDFVVSPTPLEYVSGEVPATISINIPAKAVKRNSIVTLTPSLSWGSNSAESTPVILQGEKVEANYQIVSFKNGGHATVRAAWNYYDGMEESDLYMNVNQRNGSKSKDLGNIKIGYGVLSTSALVSRTAATTEPSVALDQYQRVISQRQAATIKFLIGQSNLRNSELNNQTIKDFIQTLRNIKNDDQSLALKGVEVSAYASPDGGYSINERLAEQRSATGENYVRQQLRTNKLSTDVDTKYTAEDWEGFQELVAQSNLKDKELILRVLSMYQDPEQREQEIRNVASVYTELADAVLPELRRARMTINYDVIGRSDEQILSTFATQPKDLGIEELLYAANELITDDSRRADVLRKATELYPADNRAYNNLAVIAMRKGDKEQAKELLLQALAKAPTASNANANMGLMALQAGNIDEAELYLGKATGAAGLDEAMGNLYIAQGKYAFAAAKLENSATNSALLAQVLNQNYAAAQETIKAIKNPDSTTAYLRAILAARQDDKSALREALESAVQQDSTLAARALRDIEFAKYKDIVSKIVR